MLSITTENNFKPPLGKKIVYSSTHNGSLWCKVFHLDKPIKYILFWKYSDWQYLLETTVQYSNEINSVSEDIYNVFL